MGNDLLDLALLETSPPRGKRLILALSGSYLIINARECTVNKRLDARPVDFIEFYVAWSCIVSRPITGTTDTRIDTLLRRTQSIQDHASGIHAPFVRLRLLLRLLLLPSRPPRFDLVRLRQTCGETLLLYGK